MEIEVGEYVRNEDGYIWQIKKTKDLDNIFIDEDGKVKEIAGETVFGDDVIVEITKHSRDIIDLIEVGDYVNGKKVKQIAMFEGFPDYPKLIFTDKKYLIPGETIENKDIKTIVTHEQFESIEYKVEEGK